MGLLDEAIREHLDLKRRRGADPEELERAEREALGPARRGPDDFDQPAMEGLEAPGHDLAADETTAYDLEHEEDWEEGFEDEEFGSPDAEHESEPRAPFAPERGYDAPAGDEPDKPWTHEPPLAGAEGGAIPPPHPADEASRYRPHPSQSVSEETAEYEVEFDEEPEHGRGDMLEDTPEFLQDTPDHDRLWFEQRPPRDFDFDG